MTISISFFRYSTRSVLTIALIIVAVLPLKGQDSRDSLDSKLDLILARLENIEHRLAAVEGGKARAADGSAPATSLESIASRLEAIDQKVQNVDRAAEPPRQDVATRFTESPVVEAGSDGFSVGSRDQAFHLKIGGYFQADSRFFMGPQQGEPSTFILRRIRPVLTGTFFKGIELRLMPDWGQGASVLQDLHLDFRFFPKASIRFGKFKSPFSLERLQSATDLNFVERAFPTNLAPNRDTGVQVYGDLVGGAFSYAIAAMNGVPDGGSSDLDTNDGKDFVGRVFFQPFIRRSADHKGKGLGFGLAASHGRQTGAVLPTYRTTPQSPFFVFANGAAADGDRKRLGPQGHYYAGPF